MNLTTLISPLQNYPLFNFPLHFRAKPSLKAARYPRNSSSSLKSFSPLHPLRVPPSAAAIRAVRCSTADDKADNSERTAHHSSLRRCNGGNNEFDVAKQITCALFYVFIGVFCPFIGFRKPALAAVATAASSGTVAREDNEEKGHRYSQYTQRLLGTVTQLLRVIEEVRNAGKEDFATAIEDGLKEVKKMRTALQEEIMNGLYSELRVLKAEKEMLMDRSEEIVGKLSRSRREEQDLMRKTKGGSDKLQRLREDKRGWEREYNVMWERIGEIEDVIERKETIALSIGVRELLSIERECEALVKNVLTELRSRGSQR